MSYGVKVKPCVADWVGGMSHSCMVRPIVC